jgi:hypothetical protein
VNINDDRKLQTVTNIDIEVVRGNVHVSWQAPPRAVEFWATLSNHSGWIAGRGTSDSKVVFPAAVPDDAEADTLRVVVAALGVPESPFDVTTGEQIYNAGTFEFNVSAASSHAETTPAYP